MLYSTISSLDVRNPSWLNTPVVCERKVLLMTTKEWPRRCGRWLWVGWRWSGWRKSFGISSGQGTRRTTTMKTGRCQAKEMLDTKSDTWVGDDFLFSWLVGWTKIVTLENWCWWHSKIVDHWITLGEESATLNDDRVVMFTGNQGLDHSWI